MGHGELEVLIAGGGVAAVEALLAMHSLAEGLVETELLAPDLNFTYRPRAVLEPFRLGEQRHYSLGDIASSHGATHRRGALAEVDAARHRVVTDRGDEIGYEVLLIAVGAGTTPALPEVITFSDDEPQDSARAFPLLSIELSGSLTRWRLQSAV